MSFSCCFADFRVDALVLLLKRILLVERFFVQVSFAVCARTRLSIRVVLFALGRVFAFSCELLLCSLLRES